MFPAFRKLDFCFASLISGQDIETSETLPGFENGVRGAMTKTHMVRCKSIVEQTRVLVVELMNQQRAPQVDMDEDDPEGADTETELETDTEVNDSAAEDGGFVDPNWEDEDEDLYMDVARVYERTLIQLGEVFPGQNLP